MLPFGGGSFSVLHRGVYGSLTPRRRRISWWCCALRRGWRGVVAAPLPPRARAIVSGRLPTFRQAFAAHRAERPDAFGIHELPTMCRSISPSRFRQSVIAIESTLLPRLEKMYHIDLFAYDGIHTTALKSAGELEGINPNGQVTDLGAALSLQGQGIFARRRRWWRGGGATILFSDGIHNGPVNVETELSRMGAAGGGGSGGGTGGSVHTVRVGSSDLEPSTSCRTSRWRPLTARRPRSSTTRSLSRH